MIREFAIEPTSVCDWASFRYIFEKLGFSEGRLGLRLPDDWPQQVLGSCTNEIDRKRIEELLRRRYATRFVSPPPLGGARPKSWREMVDAVNHRRDVAGAIVADLSGTNPKTVPLATIADVTDDFLGTAREAVIPSTARAIVDVAKVLIRLSPKICIVDPYFKVTSAGWRDTLTEMTKTCRRERCERLEIVTTSDRIPRDAGTTLQRFVDGVLGGQRRPSVCVRFLSGGERMHHRFLLSEVGAIRYDRGFEAVGQEVEADVAIVDERRHSDLIHRYLGSVQHCNDELYFEFPCERRGFAFGSQPGADGLAIRQHSP